MVPSMFEFAKVDGKTILISASMDGTACLHDVPSNGEGPKLKRTLMHANKDAIFTMFVAGDCELATGHLRGMLR